MNFAIRDSECLLRSSEIFLWDDGFGDVSKNREETSSQDNGNYSASPSISDSKMISNDAEDIDLVREMNAMGLPSSFRTNKNRARKESRRSGNRATLAKSYFILDDKEDNVVSVCGQYEKQNSSFEDVSILCSVEKSEDISVDRSFCSSECYSEGTRFYVKGVEWGVFWDDFYSKNYYYNFHTDESIWSPPPEMEHCNLVKEESYISEIQESSPEGALGLQKEQSNEESPVHEAEYDLNSNLNSSTSVVSKNLGQQVEKIVLSSEDSLDSTDQISRSTSSSSEICFQEEGTSILQTTDLMLISDSSNNHHNVLKGYAETRAKRIRPNRKRLVGEKKGEQIRIGVMDFEGQSPILEMEGISPHLAKYWCQRYLLFSKFDSGVKTDEEGWFSVTPEAIARHHASSCSSSDLVLDAFCGVGGNTIQFAVNAGRVLAIDIDPKKVEYAKHNAGIYGVGDKIEFMVGDFFILSSRLKADVVFLSPPWGGPDYVKVPTYDIHSMLKPHSGKFLLETAAKIAKKVIMFLPKNIDPDQLGELAHLFDPPWKLEVEKNYLNGRLKGVTAYFSNQCCGRSLESP